MDSTSLSELEKRLISELKDEDEETRKFVMEFVCAVSDFVNQTEGRLIRALVNGDDAEITADDLLRYAKTLPVETYISIFRKMYVDMKKYHHTELIAIENDGA